MAGYLVCATPRTGSTLLCGLLASSRVAGVPESYFRTQDESAWAARFGLRDAYRYTDFVRAAKRHGSTDNGVFGARVMWGTLDELVDRLRPESGPGSDLEVLRAVFDDLAFVHVRRGDVLAQAVSWAIAEQSNVWHEGVDAHRDAPRVALTFDRELISNLVRTIEDHDRCWREWFERVGVEPCEVLYEDLDGDPISTAKDVLQALGVDAPAEALEVRFERMADAVNQEWTRRYRARPELGEEWRDQRRPERGQQ